MICFDFICKQGLPSGFRFQKCFVGKTIFFFEIIQNHYRISLRAEKGAEKVVTCCPPGRCRLGAPAGDHPLTTQHIMNNINADRCPSRQSSIMPNTRPPTRRKRKA